MSALCNNNNSKLFSDGIGKIVGVAGQYFGREKFSTSFTALIVAALVAAAFGWSEPALNGTTVISVVGSVPRTLPMPHILQTTSRVYRRWSLVRDNHDWQAEFKVAHYQRNFTC
jgi:hypothetical protein